MEKTKKRNMIVFASLFMIAISILTFGSIAALDTTTPISLATISQHSSSTNCWTVINDKVYDITSYVNSHPGGSAIAAICGIDGSNMFAGQHPLSYLGIIGSYQIGILATPDTTDPIITILGTNPVSLNVGNSYTDAGASATDNVDGDLTSAIIAVNGVDTSTPGSYTVTYSVTDAAGNSAIATRNVVVNAIVPVNITDKTKPKITLLGSKKGKLHVGDSYTDAGASATDNVDGDLTSSIVIINKVNTSKAGTYLVKYKVTDAAGNTAKVSRIVIVTKSKIKDKESHNDNDDKDDDKNEKYSNNHKKDR